MSYATCDCENHAHFNNERRTPNGNPGHKYQSQFHADVLTDVKTPYGTFRVCRDCLRDCHAKAKTVDMVKLANNCSAVPHFREEEIGGVVDAAGNVSSDAEGGL